MYKNIGYEDEEKYKYDFMECHVCDKKPGMIELCLACRWNRRTVELWKEKNSKDRVSQFNKGYLIGFLLAITIFGIVLCASF